VQLDTEQEQDFLGRADTAGEHQDAVGDAHKGLQALLDIREDHQLADNGVRRLRGNDAGLGDADVAAVLFHCLAWAIAAPFIGPFMAPGPQPVQMS
jgi:hypothetical protein